MNLLLIQELIRVAIGMVGVLSVYCGYKLFCEIPFARRRAGIHALSGALLALFGVSILIADVRGISTRLPRQHQPVQNTRPADAGSFTPHTDHRSRASYWTI